ncbi:DUF3667 domain-containing protein [Flavisolibacter nicotianae]|uniref:DUF3667 domain-containing protein n=1 Tax=Flavisolibacter nicotianae TaxID=2364882 RepID=UPI0013C4C2B1|nr:DUF3667 domain-containing protein [Flavisolibacter nicotianae]
MNCGTQVHGRFCHVCGQENVVTHQKFWSLAKHFIFDILHFDGKFFHTLLFIFTRPGFVAKQYVQGKRISYLDPIRMYLFTSALFFLVFFSAKAFRINPENKSGRLSGEDRQEMIAAFQKKLAKHPGDPVLLKSMAMLQDTTIAVNLDSLDRDQNAIDFTDRKYTSVVAYDSIQATLAKGQRDGWMKRSLVKQAIKVNGKYGNGTEMVNVYIETFLHKLPYLLFLSLPFFALILKLLYSRRKNFYYSDHAVFTLYHYIFSFILLLLVFGSSRLQEWSHWSVFGWLTSALLLAWPVYLFLEMRRFYQQGRARTLGKFLLLNIAGSIILVLLFIIFLVLSIFQL